MNKQIFKGFKQVTLSDFNKAKESNSLSGYLWFVRTEVKTDAETDVNDVNNDEYDIYFGSRKYGHFCEGELDGIKNSIIELGDNIEGILGTLTTLAESVGANAQTISDNADNIALNTQAIDDIKNELSNILIKNIDTNDNVLTVADGILSSNIAIKYENNRISLIGNNGEIAGFDASEFIKDSVLEDVYLSEKDGEKYIVFSWKIEGEEPKTQEIKVSDFAKLYKAGKALEISEDGVTFNVKIAAVDNFLSVNSNNELIVDDVTTDKTMLKEDITIEGGPLASDAVKNAFQGGVIPAGTDIQAILKALLCVEIYPVTVANTNSIGYTISISAPTVTANVSNGDLVEVGQSITFNTVTANPVSISTTKPTVEKFDNGYSETIDGDIINEKIIYGDWSINRKADNVYQLSANSTNFIGNLPNPKIVQNETNSNCVLSSCTLTAVIGSNTYSVEEDAPIHVGTYTGIDAKYIVSNLGGRSENHKSQSIPSQTEPIEKDPQNKTTTFTVTGVYPVFNNVASGTSENNVDVNNKMKLSSGKTFEIVYGSETNAYNAFAYPSTHSLSKVEVFNTMSQVFEEFTGGYETEDTTYKIQDVDTEYKVWHRRGPKFTDSSTLRFTLNKNLNTK